MFRKSFRTVSILVVFALIFQLIGPPLASYPRSVSAETITEPSSVTDAGAPPEENDPEIIGELPQKRERHVKHFMKNDFTYEAAVYPGAVHYRENGAWQDIDNTLFETEDEENETVLENKKNSFKVKFAKHSMAKNLVTVTMGK